MVFYHYFILLGGGNGIDLSGMVMQIPFFGSLPKSFLTALRLFLLPPAIQSLLRGAGSAKNHYKMSSKSAISHKNVSGFLRKALRSCKNALTPINSGSGVVLGTDRHPPWPAPWGTLRCCGYSPGSCTNVVNVTGKYQFAFFRCRPRHCFESRHR